MTPRAEFPLEVIGLEIVSQCFPVFSRRRGRLLCWVKGRVTGFLGRWDFWLLQLHGFRLETQCMRGGI